MRLFFSSLPCCTISWELFSSEELPCLVFWLESWSFELPTLLCTPKLSGEKTQKGKEKWWEFFPGSWLRILGICNHFCYWHSCYCHCCHFGLALGLEGEDGNQQNKQHHHRSQRKLNTLPLSFRGPVSCSLNQKERVSLRGLSVCIGLQYSISLWSCKGTVSSVVPPILPTAC